MRELSKKIAHERNAWILIVLSIEAHFIPKLQSRVDLLTKKDSIFLSSILFHFIPLLRFRASHTRPTNRRQKG